MFQASVCASYSPTSRFVMNAGATMNSTTPMTRPSTMENAISFLPNTASPSDFAAGSLAAAAGMPSADADAETTSSERCAPRASITVSGRPKSPFQENVALAGPGTGASPSGLQAFGCAAEQASASPASGCSEAAPTPTMASSAPEGSQAAAFAAIRSEPVAFAHCVEAESASSSSSSLNAWSAAISSAL